jgi:hypothetical protein
MMFRKQPGESESAFMKRIQQLASDPKAFERAALGKDDDPAGGGGGGGRSPTSLPYSSHSSGGNNGTDASSFVSNEGAPVARKQGGYQRVEEWDREQRELAKKGTLSWEERVQFDGQRHGNRFQQNEILRHHLKTF